MTGHLIILRHGESTWNAKGVWTGTSNVHLTPKGRADARLMGQAIQELHLDVAYISQQIRTLETLQEVLAGMGVAPDSLPHHVSAALNERDYGIYTGQNKWQVKEQVGEEQFQAIRRGWDTPIPEGESLKQVYDRAVPFYLHTILPLLQSGQSVLVVAHGNSIRSLMKYLETITDAGVQDLEMIFGTILDYQVDQNGRMTQKAVKTVAITPSQA